MARLIDIVKHEVDQYAGISPNSTPYPIFDDEHKTYTVMSVGKPANKYPVRPIVMARIEGDMVIIEADSTNRPLVDALLQAGIPREKIVLAYAGEGVSEA